MATSSRSSGVGAGPSSFGPHRLQVHGRRVGPRQVLPAQRRHKRDLHHRRQVAAQVADHRGILQHPAEQRHDRLVAGPGPTEDLGPAGPRRRVRQVRVRWSVRRGRVGGHGASSRGLGWGGGSRPPGGRPPARTRRVRPIAAGARRARRVPAAFRPAARIGRCAAHAGGRPAGRLPRRARRRRCTRGCGGRRCGGCGCSSAAGSRPLCDTFCVAPLRAAGRIMRRIGEGGGRRTRQGYGAWLRRKPTLKWCRLVARAAAGCVTCFALHHFEGLS